MVGLLQINPEDGHPEAILLIVNFDHDIDNLVEIHG